MATNSIYNTIKVTDKKFCKSLVSSLENARGSKGKKVEYSKGVSVLSASQIKAMFGDKE